MLEKIDLSKSLSKKEFKRMLPELQNHLYAVQKASWDAGVPVVVLFEGWDAAGKGTSIQTLTSRLDPRGFKLHPIRAARTYEKKRPWLWRFWLKIPGRGEWAIFDRSWYGRVLVERVEKLIPESEWRVAYRDVVDFERALADDGYLLVKFFLHISREEQRRRFEKLTKDPLNAWHVTPEDWEHHRNYDNWLLAYEEMLERTETEWGPWTIVEATDRQFTQVKIYQTLIRVLEDRLASLNASPDPALWRMPSKEPEPVGVEAAAAGAGEETPPEVEPETVGAGEETPPAPPTPAEVEPQTAGAGEETPPAPPAPAETSAPQPPEEDEKPKKKEKKAGKKKKRPKEKSIEKVEEAT
jgi:polyphosphate kinase 2 (PPK2 family)